MISSHSSPETTDSMQIYKQHTHVCQAVSAGPQQWAGIQWLCGLAGMHLADKQVALMSEKGEDSL